MIAAPDHLARRGTKPSVRPRERHVDAETKARPDSALPKLRAVPLGPRQWDRGTGRDISPPMTWCGTIAAGPMCAQLYGGTSLERRGHPAAVFSPGALYTLLDCGGQSPRGSVVQLVGASLCTMPAPPWRAWAAPVGHGGAW